MSGNVLGKIVAPLACFVGYLARRPVSGRWLAHFLWASGRARRLPSTLEEQLRREWWEGYSRPVARLDWDFAERGYVPPDASVLFLDDDAGDLYSTVGSLCVWVREGYLHYLDVYNWQTGSDGLSWEIPFSLGPLHATIRGNDWWWEGRGKIFITEGQVSLDRVSGIGDG